MGEIVPLLITLNFSDSESSNIKPFTKIHKKRTYGSVRRVQKWTEKPQPLRRRRSPTDKSELEKTERLPGLLEEESVLLKKQVEGQCHRPVARERTDT